MKTRRVFIFCFFLILYCSSMFAGTGMGRYAFRSLDINNGLSQNTVAAIIQDRFGFMWFGTKDGLNRYDGVSFQTFMKESGTLGNNFITSLYEDYHRVYLTNTRHPDQTQSDQHSLTVSFRMHQSVNVPMYLCLYRNKKSLAFPKQSRPFLYDRLL